MGIDADDVLPYRSMLRKKRSIGMPDALRDALDDAQVRLVGDHPGRRRRASRPFASSAAFDAGGHVAHGVLEDLARRSSSRSAACSDRLGRQRLRGCRRPGCRGCRSCEPSANRCVDSMPRLAVRRRPPCSTAPAPSPNSTQVSRSVQSTMRDSTSTPMTSTRLNCPVRMNASRDRQAVEEAGARRREIERRSRPARAQLLLHEGRGGRERACRGVTVPTMMQSIAAGSTPAAAHALQPGLGGEIAGRQRRIEDAALADPGALDDPAVGGVDHLLEVVVGQHLAAVPRVRCRRCGCAS